MFNIRVYGILMNEAKQILLSDEYIRGSFITKFPGGGMEIGEGTRDCLKREFMEEMNLPVSVEEHIYTTDYFQPSSFRENQQVIAIYYFVKALAPITVPLRKKAFDFDEEQLSIYQKTGEIETFRFVSLADFSPDQMSLPIDKIIARLLINQQPPAHS
jgi:8-oxo-dGTP diphosphatase